MTVFEPRAPLIFPCLDGIHRPKWSVMIPVYEPQSFLIEALQSVLSQNFGPDKMQIAVVDDSSPTVDVKSLVEQCGDQRIEYYRSSINIGPLNNWNRCLELARGQWIHLLHQDDLVERGFYEKLERGLAGSVGAGAACCRYAHLNSHGQVESIMPLERESPGLLESWQERLAITPRVHFVSFAVRRDVYEVLGGFSHTSASAADWEMWQRIAGSYPIWYEPTVLAGCRAHNQSQTSQLLRSGRNIADSRLSIDASSQYIPPSSRSTLRQAANEHYAIAAVQIAESFLKKGDFQAALSQIREGLHCHQSERLRKRLMQALRTLETLPSGGSIDSFYILSTSEQTNDARDSEVLLSIARSALESGNLRTALFYIDSSLKRSKSFTILERLFVILEESITVDFTSNFGTQSDSNWRILRRQLEVAVSSGCHHTIRAIRLQVLRDWIDDDDTAPKRLWNGSSGQVFRQLVKHNSGEISPGIPECPWLQYLYSRTDEELNPLSTQVLWKLEMLKGLYGQLSSCRSTLTDIFPRCCQDFLAKNIFRLCLNSYQQHQEGSVSSDHALTIF